MSKHEDWEHIQGEPIAKVEAKRAELRRGIAAGDIQVPDDVPENQALYPTPLSIDSPHVEIKLCPYGLKSYHGGANVSQERWDEIFGKKKKVQA